MHPSLLALPLEEKGLVLAAMLGRLPPETVRARLGGAAGERCAEAVRTLSTEPKPTRASAMAALIALLRAPIAEGLEHIHRDWIHERLADETSAVVDLVTANLPPPVQAVAEDLLAERHQQRTVGAPVRTAGATAVRRAVFAGMVPLRGPGAPAGALARTLVDLSTPELLQAIDLRGAETLGASLRGAPGAVVARAAAGLDRHLGDALLESAAKEETAAAREAARAIVAAAVGNSPGDRVRDTGLQALAVALTDEGTGAIVAVAQCLPTTLGRRLLEAARVAGAL